MKPAVSPVTALTPSTDSTTNTLTGGTYNVTGTLQFNGANIVANAANITLTGSSSQIINQTTGNGLANFAINNAGASFTINGGRNFTTAGNFTNSGTLTVGASNSKFKVNGNLTNFNSTTGTLTGGTYALTGTLQFNGANIKNNAANITLTGSSAKITNQTSGNGLANLAANMSSGKFTVTGGQALSDGATVLSNSGSLTVGKSSKLTLTAATGAYKQTGGTTTVDGTLTAPGGITFSGGSVFGNGGTFSGKTTLSGGTFNIGDVAKTAGVESITGAYTQSSGGLNIDIGGTTVGTKFDQLNIAGAAALNGTLNLGLLNGFVPTLGATFDIMNFASHGTSTFSKITGTAINGSEHFSVIYSAKNVTVDVVKGPGPVLSNGLLAHGSPSPVPEPGTLLLLGTGLLGLAAFVRRRRRLPVRIDER